MKISFTSLKVSMAGAKLSHLVQKDKIWDHGSMTEQAKNIFYQVEKAKNKKNAEGVKKYLTTSGYEQLNEQIKNNTNPLFSKNTVITEIFIIEVNEQKNKHPDRFTALIKGKRKSQENEIQNLPAGGQDSKVKSKNQGIENFSERWFFVRRGEWWLLNGMKN